MSLIIPGALELRIALLNSNIANTITINIDNKMPKLLITTTRSLFMLLHLIKR